MPGFIALRAAGIMSRVEPPVSPRDAPPISAVVFDLYITLTDFDAERRRPRMLAELGETLGVNGPAFAFAMRSTFADRATGSLGDLRSTFATLCRRLGGDPSPARLDEAVELRLSQERELLSPRPDVLGVLAAVRAAGRRVGVITDCTTELPDLWPGLPYASLVDAVVFSCQVGHRKPHRSLYAEAARLLAVPPERCLYVGDGGSHELTGAEAAGMTPVLLATPLSAEFRYDPEPAWPGPVIAELVDILRFLRPR
jgi:putative hydrolase of the HAD superfamily